MKTKLFPILVLLMLLGWQANAQKTKQCKVDYDVEILEMADADPMTRSMMEGMTLTLAFQDRAARVEMHMSMMDMVVIADDEAKQGVALMDMMGMKMATPMGEEEFADAGQDQGDTKVRETGKTKKIAGHKCYQAFVSDAEGSEVEIWYTKDIIVDNRSSDYTYEGIDGFPLEMVVDQDGVKMRMTASDVDTDKMPKSFFSTEVPDGYTIQDPNNPGMFGE